MTAKAAREEAKLQVMQSADIIGMTCTGCAMNQDLIRQLQPSVLIVEEVRVLMLGTRLWLGAEES